MKSILSFLLFLCFFTPLISQNETQNVNADEGAIFVSKDLYEEILNWLTLENSEKPLDAYLLSTALDNLEVTSFLQEFYSGNKSNQIQKSKRGYV